MLTSVLPLALVAVVAYFAIRSPVSLALSYVAFAPFDAYQVAFAGMLLSLADIALLGLVTSCFLMRPRTPLFAPRWYTLAIGMLAVAVFVSLVGNYPNVDLGAARALVAKLVGGFCVCSTVIRARTPLVTVMYAFAIGVGMSVALGLLQQFVYLWFGWDALLATLPRVMNPGGVGGYWADAVSRGDLGFAVVSPSRGFTPFAMRMPGGTPHTALLGLLVAFPLGLGAGALFCRRRPIWTGLVLVATGIMGFCVTEGRAALLGVAVSVAWLLARQLFFRRSLSTAALLMITLAIQVTLFVSFLDQDMGLRRDAMRDAVSDVTRFIIGMGPGEYESHSSIGINVHSTPLQVFTDIGFVGFMAYLALMIGSVIALWRNSRDQDVLILGAGVFGYLVSAIFFHPSAGTREHWIVVTMAAMAGHCGAVVARKKIALRPRFAPRVSHSLRPAPWG